MMNTMSVGLMCMSLTIDAEDWHVCSTIVPLLQTEPWRGNEGENCSYCYTV